MFVADYVINRPVVVYASRYRRLHRMRSMLRRHGQACAYCGEEMMLDQGYNHPSAPSRDHDWPLSRGGSDALPNLVLAHRFCNEDKGSLTGEEYRAWLAGLASRLDRRRERTRLVGVG